MICVFGASFSLAAEPGIINTLISFFTFQIINQVHGIANGRKYRHTNIGINGCVSSKKKNTRHIILEALATDNLLGYICHYNIRYNGCSQQNFITTSNILYPYFLKDALQSTNRTELYTGTVPYLTTVILSNHVLSK